MSERLFTNEEYLPVYFEPITPEVPEGIKDLMWSENTQIHTTGWCMNEKVIIYFADFDFCSPVC